MSRLVVEFSAGGSDQADISFDELRGRPAAVDRAAGLLEAVEPSVRDDYVRWIGDRGVEAMAGSGPAARPTRSGIPVWWLSSASMRDNEADPTFASLCRLAAVDRALSAGSATALTALNPDAPMDAVLARLCRERGAAYSSSGVRPGDPGPRLGPALAGRVRVAFRLLAARLLALTLPRPPRGSGAIAFLCAWPETLSFEPEPRDRSFRGLLDGARTRLGATVVALIVPTLERSARITDLVRGARGASVAALPRFSRVADLVAVGRSAGLALACVSEARRIGRDGGSRFRGIDARELLDLPLLATLARAEVAQHLAVEAQAERWARRVRPGVLVSALELYPVARAVYAGARKGNPAVRVVAVQHATVTPGKLWYALDPRERRGAAAIPVPDVVLCQGESARGLLASGGFVPEQLPLTGSPRYDELRAAEDERTPPGAGRVLVLPSLDRRDGELLVEASLAAARAAGARELVVLAHPLQPGPAELLARLAPSALEVSVERGSLYEALAGADVAIASYSTAADEAIVRRVPTIAYGGLRPFMGSASWTGAIPFARTPAALGELLTGALPRGPAIDEEELQRHIMWVFHRLDGRATERCLEVISGVAAGGPAPENPA